MNQDDQQPEHEQPSQGAPEPGQGGSPEGATSHGDSPDYYAVLGLPPGAGRRTVAEAYDKLARRLQPDENAPPVDPDRMRQIDEAFDVLDDRRRRAAYDEAHGIVRLRDPARGPLADRALLLAVGLIIAGIVAVGVGAVILIIDLWGGSEGPLITTASGLQYVDLKVGDGPQPESGDTVTVQYVGKLADGTVFDDSRSKDAPFTFLLGHAAVIKGWDEGISTMRKGGKRRLIIPPSLGYGAKGLGNTIPPNATLTFEVELVDVKAGVPQGSPSPTPFPLPTQVPTTAPATPPPVTGQETTTPSGLKYVDIRAGTGQTAASGNTVIVNYTGWLADGGKKFDSSLERPQPFAFQLGSGMVIKGWDEGIAGMKVGGKRRLTIPPALGYGAQGVPPTIPANATLIFDVELLDVR